MMERNEGGLHRQTLSAQIYESLEGKILRGEMPPGTKLSEEALADRYGVSRAPVREALTALQRAGFAEKYGARDRIIAIPTADLIAQKYDLWWVLDVGRTYLAALEASTAHCDALQAMIHDMRQALHAQDAAEYRRLATLYHETIRQGCKNPYVADIAANCDIHVRWFEALYDQHPEMSEAVVREHAEILDAYRARDFNALAQSIRAHMLRQRDHILMLFQAAAKTAGSAD
jgi:DNA-binding GntR family transcriptional regulator